MDDIGAATEDKDSISNALFRLVNWRHGNLSPTIYTSNVALEGLKCDDRICENSIHVIMTEISIWKKEDKSRQEFLDQVMRE